MALAFRGRSFDPHRVRGRRFHSVQPGLCDQRLQQRHFLCLYVPLCVLGTTLSVSSTTASFCLLGAPCQAFFRSILVPNVPLCVLGTTLSVSSTTALFCLLGAPLPSFRSILFLNVPLCVGGTMLSIVATTAYSFVSIATVAREGPRGQSLQQQHFLCLHAPHCV